MPLATPGDPAVVIENLTLEIPARRTRATHDHFRERLREQRRTRTLLLSDISLHLSSGDSLALVGPNGAGKTTLLRCIAGLYQPSRGRIAVRGRVVSLINWMTGLDMEETGIENAYALGYFLGLRKSELRARLPDVIDFAGLGEFIYEPLYTYSAGMVTRLAFAVATSVECDILLLDEGINAGDAEFQARAQQRVRELLSSARIVVLATHAGDLAQQYCNRAVYLSLGRLAFSGTLEETMSRYLADVGAAATT